MKTVPPVKMRTVAVDSEITPAIAVVTTGDPSRRQMTAAQPLGQHSARPCGLKIATGRFDDPVSTNNKRAIEGSEFFDGFLERGIEEIPFCIGVALERAQDHLMRKLKNLLMIAEHEHRTHGPTLAPFPGDFQGEAEQGLEHGWACGAVDQGPPMGGEDLSFFVAVEDEQGVEEARARSPRQTHQAIVFMQQTGRESHEHCHLDLRRAGKRNGWHTQHGRELLARIAKSDFVASDKDDLLFSDDGFEGCVVFNHVRGEQDPVACQGACQCSGGFDERLGFLSHEVFLILRYRR
jgi:hypothetical protein